MQAKSPVQRKHVSVVIVTRNRVNILAQCLLSLANQTILPSEVVVIDNNSTDGTKKWVRSWSRSAPFSVRLISEKRVGYPYVYNRGLREAKYDWVGFIDDDCIADPDWYEQAVKAVTDFPRVVTVVGFSGTQKPTNIYSLATFLFQLDWKEKWTTGHTVHNYEVLDNKNIFYFRPFLEKNKIQFDEGRIETVGGAAEDCDLGWKIQMAKGKAIYQRKMKVKHKDPDNWQWYWKKYFTSLAAFTSFVAEREQGMNEIASSLTAKKVPFRKHALALADQYGPNVLWKMKFLLVVYSTVGMSFLLAFLFTFAPFRAWYIRAF